MKKILLMLLFSAILLFGSFDLNKATKNELMQIKGIGAKKAELILEYRKNKEINSAKELQSLKGFGPVLISNIEQKLAN